MKNLKKLLAITCAIAMVFSLSVSALAAPAGTATVTVAVTGEANLLTGYEVEASTAFDAITQALEDNGLSYVDGYDAEPSYGDPGYFISSIAGYVTYNDFNENFSAETGYYVDGEEVYRSTGGGWTATMNGFDAWNYLSNEPITGDMDIVFTYGEFDMLWNYSGYYRDLIADPIV